MTASDSPRVDSRPPWIERAGALERHPAVDIADLLLLDLVSRRTAATVIAPEAPRHTVRYLFGNGEKVQAELDPALADAVAARMALIAGLDLAASAPQVGRLRVRRGRDGTDPGGRAADLLLALRPTPQGFAAELRLVSSPEDVRAPSSTSSGVTDVATGRMLVGKYRLEDELGSGGMGVVYRAEHCMLHKPVAIKVLHPGIADDPAMAAQFVLEARAPCIVRHPGIVEVTDFGKLPDGRSFIVMELVECPTLAKVLHDGPLGFQRAVVLARSITEALAAVSAHGVVHRDLKPANIFVLPRDRTKICDFGVSSVAGFKEATSDFGSIAGTPAYMAPEQMKGQEPTVHSDLYSLGCVLFEMLAGQPPYTGSTAISVMQQHEFAPIPDVVSPLGPVPDILQRIVTRAMAKLPEERYQSAEEMRAALTHAAEVLARPGWRRWLPI